IEEDLHQYDDKVAVDWASGACFFIRAQDFHRFGGFDKLFFAHMEEIDLCWRLRSAGKQILYNGGIQVYHVDGGTCSRQIPVETYRKVQMHFLMLEKDSSPRQRLGTDAVRCIFDLADAQRFCVGGGGLNGKAEARAYRHFFKLSASVKKA